jgi:hypothetical protein
MGRLEFIDLRKQGIPRLPEPLQLREWLIFRQGLVNSFQIAGDAFLVLPGDVAQTFAHHVNPAQLNPCVRTLDCDRIGEAFEAIHLGNQYVLHASAFEFGENGEPELGALVFRHPQSQ